MRSYLSLISISTKVRKKQSRMTVLCIVIAVFLVTIVFSMTDMLMRAELSHQVDKNGSWHLMFEDISDLTASDIASRLDVAAAGWSSAFNVNAEQDYEIGDVKAALYGTDAAYIEQLMEGLKEGKFPSTDHEVMLSTNARDYLNLKIGDTVVLHTPAGASEYTVSGFGGDDEAYYEGQFYLVGVYMTREAFQFVMEENGVNQISSSFYVQFHSASKADRARTEIKEQYQLSDGQIGENTAVMGLSGASSNESMMGIYGIAVVLFVLVLMAGVLMISGSMNSNISQRMNFFGMLRCIGASKKQIMRIVRLEALNWCKIGIPVGVILGTVINDVLCIVLKYGVGGEFAGMPVFAISKVGIISGIAVGLITVLLAAQSPARKASKVSPAAAVSGDLESNTKAGHAAGKIYTRIETSLGIHHAVSNKKNWFLMTGSFALSIVVFLCFSVGMDLAHALLPSLRAWQPDCTINGYANADNIDSSMKEKINEIPGVEQVFGDAYASDVPAVSSETSVDRVNIVSYDDYMIKMAGKSVVKGDISEIGADNGKVMTICNKNNPLHEGDTIEINGTEVEVACELSDGLFSDDCIIVCSEDTFEKLVGEQDYFLLGVKLSKDADQATIRQISALVGENQIFTDNRKSNQETNATYMMTRIVGYSFLMILAMITVFYIMNSISMSVSARIRQYGYMRAIGMDRNQLKKMISAEAFTYAVSGLIVGCAIGLPISRAMYVTLITRHFGNVWQMPVQLFAVIVVFVMASAAAAVWKPAKRISEMAITETINEL